MKTFLPKIRRLILEIAHPVIPWIGKIEWPVKRRLGIDQYGALLKNPDFVPGCVLLSRKRLSLSNFFLPGEWKHASIYVGYRDGHPQVVEAVWPKVHDKWLLKWLQGEDYIEVLAPTFLPDKLLMQKIMFDSCEFAWSIRGLGYDLNFEYTDDRKTNKAFYCSEVIWWAYNQVMKAWGLVSPFTPEISLGVETIAPSDYALATTKFKSIASWKRKSS